LEETPHEGTAEVKRIRKNTLIQKYEMFIIKTNKSIHDVQKRFIHIVNHLMTLEKTFDKVEPNIKIYIIINFYNLKIKLFI